MQTSLFTTMLRTELMDAINNLQGQPPAPWEDYTTKLVSTARIEQYPWMSAMPGLNKYAGYRRYANIDSIKYNVINQEFDASFQVRKRDVDDDQVGGYKLSAQALVKKAALFPGRLVLLALQNGLWQNGFDGTAFFASSHTQGTGNNIMTGTAAASDGVSHNIVIMIKTGMVKPLMFQERKPLSGLDTDEGTPQSREEKMLHYWVDWEGAACYGFWWDAVLIQYSNTPTLTEIQTDLGLAESRIRGFILPKGLATDQSEYPHEQLVFNGESVTVMSSTTIANKVRTVMESELIAQGGAAVTNIFYGWAKHVPTPYLDGAMPSSSTSSNAYQTTAGLSTS